MKTKITLFLVLIFGTLLAKKDTICITLRPSAAAGQDIDARISTQVPTANFSTDPDFFSATWTCGSAGNCI
ncbi:MAG TPA: hypothetical protein VK783_11945, partial [Bacteroidia bacterium]|nr:hypothetical protein [Bacteroidia bacterium]